MRKIPKVKINFSSHPFPWLPSFPTHTALASDEIQNGEIDKTPLNAMLMYIGHVRHLRQGTADKDLGIISPRLMMRSNNRFLGRLV